jgi:hypothetical protein
MIGRFSLRPIWPVLVVVIGSLGWCSAAAASEGPGWEIVGRFGPTVLVPGGNGTLTLYVYNIGAATGGEGTLIDTLPVGLTAAGGLPSGCKGEGGRVVECEVGSSQAGSGEPSAVVKVPVEVAADAAGENIDTATVSGGGAAEAANTSVPVRFGSVPASAGFSAFDGWLSSADGTTDTQAGSHPYALTVTFSANSVIKGGRELPVGEPRDLEFKVPPGFVGNPTAVPQCPRWKFDEGELGEQAGKGCPSSSRIGIDFVQAAGLGLVRFPVYNLVPPPGVAAEFAFSLDGISSFLDARVRSGGDYGITEHVGNVAQRQILFNTTTIWGVPAEANHDLYRGGSECLPDPSGGCGYRGPDEPFLTLPTSCAGPQKFEAEMIGTWAEPNVRASASFLTHEADGKPVGFTDCEGLVHFEPSAEIVPDTTVSDTPAGLAANVRVPQGVNPEELATSGVYSASVTLSEGLVINPGQATGLVACQPAQEKIGGLEAEDESMDGPPECPSASKVGTDEISTPLLPDKLEGNVYILSQNPPNLQILVAASGDGVNIKVIGNVHLNESSGRVETTFTDLPNLPFTDFKLDFSGGARAALATPTTCGVYSTSAVFGPWSGLENAFSNSQFEISSAPAGGGCGSSLPFAPVLTAGSTTDQADGYTGFTMLLQRGDGQQRISSLHFEAPEGLAGMISTVPLCGEPQAADGSCSQASEIGHTVVTSGPGPYPFEVPQAGSPEAPIYLTGPYEGAPFGLSIVVPVQAGPFNLGIVVVRAKIEVDKRTAQVGITTGTLPRILDGIPTDLRTIDAVINRPGFMFNPTNCTPMSFSGTAYAYEGASAALSSRFQVGSCAGLAFKPDFTVSTSGRPSRADGARLTAKIVYPTSTPEGNQASSQANLARVKVELPKRLPSRLSTLQKACTAAVFAVNPAACPQASVVGHAVVHTPVLSDSLTGPVYFVSHGGEAFPSLIMLLQGQGVAIELEGSTFISSKGITTSTFKATPDVPFTSFELVLPQGPYSALAANGNLCQGALEMPTELVGQNGAVINQKTKINVTGCPKKKVAKAKKSAKGKKKTAAGKKGAGGKG